MKRAALAPMLAAALSMVLQAQTRAPDQCSNLLDQVLELSGWNDMFSGIVAQAQSVFEAEASRLRR